MAYPAPTAADIKTRFPEFADVADATIDAAIAEAGSYVDQSWGKNYTAGVQYWVAQDLVIQGLGTSTQAQVSSIGDFNLIKSGDLEVRRGTAQSGATKANLDDIYARTTYGQKFLALRGVTFPPIGIF